MTWIEHMNILMTFFLYSYVTGKLTRDGIYEIIQVGLYRASNKATEFQ